MFQVNVKTLDGRNSAFTIEDENMTVNGFKRLIEPELGIAVDQQRLIFQGRVLQDEQTLTTCGVQGNVVHLVSKPPPSARTQQSASTSPSGASVNIEGTPLGEFNLQQTIQEITSGLLRGVSGIGRVANIPMPSEGGSDDSQSDRNMITQRLNTFRNLHRQASRIMRRINQCNTQTTSTGPEDDSPAAAVPSFSRDTSSPDDSRNLASGTETSVTEAVPSNDIHASVDTQPDGPELNSSPMLVDEDKNCNGGTPDAAESDTQRPSHTEPNEDSSSTEARAASLAGLANVLKTYRELWRQSEPYLEQWEAMLIAESETRMPSRGDIEVESVPVQSNSSVNPLPETAGGSLVWHQRSFNLVSTLLHLHAHMLHLISDFNVTTRDMEPRRGEQSVERQTDVHTSDTTAPSQTEQSGASGSGIPMDTDATPQNVAPKSTAESHPSRILTVPESDRRWLRTRVNVESPEITVGTSTGEPHRPLYSSLYRTRSRSASNLNRTSTTVVDSVSTTTTPTTTSSSVSGQTAIIHRVDIPIFSMNMINVPTASLMPLIPTSSISQPSSTTAANTDPLVSTAQTSLASGTGTTYSHAPMRTLHPFSFPSSTDPYLHCNSRHFAHNIHHGVTGIHGLFDVPLTSSTAMSFTPFVDAGRSRPQTTAPNSIGNTQPVMSTTVSSSTTESTTSSTTNSTNTTPSIGDFSLPGFNLSQQIVSFVSAAANAAVSATSSGGANSPFNVLVSSSPIHFTIGTTFSTLGMPFPTTTTRTVNSTAGSNRSQIPTRTSSSAPTQVQRQTPAWATSDKLTETNLLGMFRVLTVLIEGLINIIWFRLSGASRNVSLCNQDTGRPQGTRVSVGLLVDVMSTACRQLANYSDSEYVLSPSSLDGMREQLQHLLRCADSAMENNQSELVEALVNSIFQGSTSDECNIEYANLLANLNSNHSKRICDVTASFVKLFRYIISSQLELWRASPTNVGFGSTLLMTLKIACLDLLCLTDVLTNELCTSMGITVPSSVDSSSNESHQLIFGFSQDFKPLLDHLNSFLQEFESDQQYSEFCQSLTTGLERCISSYLDLDEVTLRAKVAHHRNSFVTIRNTNIDSPYGEKKFVNCNPVDEDMNGEDLPFVDACSELPSEGYVNSHVHSSYNKTSAKASNVTEKISSLPEWTPKPGQIPEDWEQALECNPQSLRPLVDRPYAGDAESWHALLPPAWIHVVAGDVANMNPEVATEQINYTDTLGRFSDGYISGMPAKRRKVMQENARSLFQSPDGLFSECLSNAVGTNHVSEYDSAAQQTTVDGLHRTCNSIQSPMESKRFPAADNELVSALRDIVSDRIASRLATDPDFDPIQFPLTNERFKKDSK